jgi:hypothetical protein
VATTSRCRCSSPPSCGGARTNWLRKSRLGRQQAGGARHGGRWCWNNSTHRCTLCMAAQLSPTKARRMRTRMPQPSKKTPGDRGHLGQLQIKVWRPNTRHRAYNCAMHQPLQNKRFKWRQADIHTSVNPIKNQRGGKRRQSVIGSIKDSTSQPSAGHDRAQDEKCFGVCAHRRAAAE